MTTNTTQIANLPLALTVPAEPATAVGRLRAHMEAEGDDLIAACAWLGGERWTMLAEQLTLAVLRGGDLVGWQRSLLEAVHRLLTLELVDDAESSEAGRFICLDLEDERVERCCRHAEVLGDVLATLRAEKAAVRRAKRQVRILAPAA